MDPKQQQPKLQDPQVTLDNNTEPTATPPEPIAPFSLSADELRSSEQPQSGQGVGITNNELSSEAKVTTDPDAAKLTDQASSTPEAPQTVSIPVYDATDPSSGADTQTSEVSEGEQELGDTSSIEDESHATVVDSDLKSTVEPAAETSSAGKPVYFDELSDDDTSDSRSAADETPKPEALVSETGLAADDAAKSLAPVPGAGASAVNDDDGTVPPLNPVSPAASKPGGSHKWIIIAIVMVIILAAGAVAALLMLKKESTKKITNAPVKVGFLMALTGGSSSMGYGTNKGIQLAKKQLGADNIEIVQADSKCDTKVAPEAIKRLIAQHVVAIIGDGCSSASTAALPAANNAKIPMISPSASTPSLSIPNDYFFRVIPNDNVQGAFLAQSIFDKGLRKISVFYTNESYGSSMSKVFKEKFESLGGKVLTSVSAESDVIDLTTQMNALKASKPDAIFFSPNSVVSATAAIKVAREVGITVPFFGADAFYDTTVIKDSGPAAATGLTISSFPTGSKSFKQALLNEYQVTEQLYGSAEAYDAFHAIYLAVKAGATTGEQVAQKLPSISFNGVSAHIAFDENGEISGKNYKYDLLQVKNGEFVAAE